MPMVTHLERIRCPECGRVCEAAVEHTWPWWTYVHECQCGHIITESEWEADDEKRD